MTRLTKSTKRLVSTSNRLYLAWDIGFSREIWRGIPSSGNELSYIMNCSRGNDGLGLHKSKFFGLSNHCWDLAWCFRCLCNSTYWNCRLILHRLFKLLTRSAKRGLKRANVQNNQFNLLISKYTKHKLTIIRCQSQRLISQLFAGKWQPRIAQKKFVAVSKIAVLLQFFKEIQHFSKHWSGVEIVLNCFWAFKQPLLFSLA